MPSMIAVDAVPKGVWTLWADVPEPSRGQLRGIYRELRARYGLRGRLGLAAGKMIAELVFTTAAASEAAARAAIRRSFGRGRRPSARQVNAVLKRAGLQLGSLNQALPGGVAALLGGNGRALTPDEMLARANRAIAADLAEDRDG
jgi:hypothetical protein